VLTAIVPHASFAASAVAAYARRMLGRRRGGTRIRPAVARPLTGRAFQRSRSHFVGIGRGLIASFARNSRTRMINRLRRPYARRHRAG